MSQKEVQANSVIYSRKDYIAVLADAQRAYTTLAALRDVQIAEWRDDTEAREADLTRIIMERYTRHESYHYNRYLESLKAPTKLSLWGKLLGRKLEAKTDKYGSLEAYVAATTGTTFAEYHASEIERVSRYGCTDRVDYLRWYSSNARRFLDNEWREQLDTVTQMLAEVEYGNFDAQFIIPRETFDNYAGAMIQAEGGKIESVDGTLYREIEWY